MTILEKVLEAMQEAEEIGGPEGDEYLYLMTQIAHTAMIRTLTAFHKKKPKPLSFNEFCDSGRNVVFKDCSELAGCDIESFMGRVYADNCYIELLTDGRWYLLLSNEEYEDTDLTRLERRLYDDHYVPNHV